MIAGRDELLSFLHVWRDDRSLLHIEIRRRDVTAAFEARVVDVAEEAFRLSARAGGLVFTVSLEPDFDVRYDDVSPAPEHRFVYDRGVALVYPFEGDDAREAEMILLIEIKEPQT